VELSEKERSLNILCGTCRQKKQSVIDSSITLPFVTRTLLRRLLDMKSIDKIDKPVCVYQDLLNLEFSQKWKELAEKKGRKAVQETLLSSEDSGTLV
jgi:hypothetical protein